MEIETRSGMNLVTSETVSEIEGFSMDGNWKQRSTEWNHGLEQSLSLMMRQLNRKKNGGQLDASESQSQFQGLSSNRDDLFLALKRPLWIGAFLGLIPIRGLRGLNSQEQTFS